MSKDQTSVENEDRPWIYAFRIQGHLDAHWAIPFEGMTITLEDDGSTLLTGPVVDQAALHGLLRKVRDLGMPLLSVNRVAPVAMRTLGQDVVD